MLKVASTPKALHGYVSPCTKKYSFEYFNSILLVLEGLYIDCSIRTREEPYGAIFKSFSK